MDNDFEKKLEGIENLIAENPDNIELLFEKTSLMIELGNLNEAFNTLDTIVKIDPNNIKALFLKAEQLSRFNKPLNAVECYNKILKIDPKNKDAWVNKGFSLVDANMVDKVIPCFEHALAIDPKDLDLWVKKLEVHKYLNDFNGMWQSLHSIRLLEPKKIELWIEQGEILMQAQKYDQALNFFNSLEKSGYKPAYIKTKKAEALFMLGKKEEASLLLEQVLDKNPNYNDALLLSAKILLSLSYDEDAVNIYQSILEEDPDSFEALMGLAEIHFNRNENLKAYDLYDQIILKNPDFAEAWDKKGIINELLGNYKEAVECYNRAIEIDKTKLTSVIHLASLLYKQSSYAESLQACDLGLVYYAQNLDLLNIRGSCLRHMKAYEEVIKTYQQILSILPDNIDAKEYIAISIGFSGQQKEAIAYLDSILQLVPDRKTAWYYKGYFNCMAKSYQEALKCQEQALQIDPEYREALENKVYAQKQIKLAEKKQAILDKSHEERKRPIGNCPMCGIDMMASICDNCGYDLETKEQLIKPQAPDQIPLKPINRPIKASPKSKVENPHTFNDKNCHKCQSRYVFKEFNFDLQQVRLICEKKHHAVIVNENLTPDIGIFYCDCGGAFIKNQFQENQAGEVVYQDYLCPVCGKYVKFRATSSQTSKKYEGFSQKVFDALKKQTKSEENLDMVIKAMLSKNDRRPSYIKAMLGMFFGYKPAKILPDDMPEVRVFKEMVKKSRLR